MRTLPENYAFPVAEVSKLLCLVIIFLLQPFSNVQAQQEADYAVQANIIYHFTKYIDWPGNKKSGDFIIGVTGDTPLYDELKKHVANKMLGRQKIAIKKFSSSAIVNASVSYEAVKGLHISCSGKNILNDRSRGFFKSDAVPFMLLAGLHYEF